MQVNKKNLQDALTIVKPGLANKEIIEQATSFAFIKGRVITYNDDISISHPVEGVNFEGAVRAEQLYALLNKLKPKKDSEGNETPIELTLNKKEILITMGKVKAGLALESEIRLPLKDELSQVGKWLDLPENYVRLLNIAMGSASRDMSRPVLTCVNTGKNGIIEASDSYRITRCDLKEEMPVNTFLIPADSVVEVVKINPTKIAEGKSWIHFKNEDETIISCRLFEESFPSTAKHVLVKGVTIKFPPTIQDMLTRAMVFAKQDHVLNEVVNLFIEEGKIKITARAESVGSWFEEESRMAYKGPPIVFSITPYLLKSILNETLACCLGDKKDKLKFEGEGWIYISMLRES